MDTTDSAAPSARKGSARTPRPSRAPRVKIDSLARVRRELARIYVDAKEGRRDVADASRLANILALIGRILEGAELERRLEALEARDAGAKP